MQNNRNYEIGKSIMLYFFSENKLDLNALWLSATHLLLKYLLREKLVYKYFLEIKIYLNFFL